LTPPRTKAPSQQNGLVTENFTLSVNALQLNIIHQFCTQAQLPTVELKRAVASLQEQVESLVPQD
jgi:hypothetical protein